MLPSRCRLNASASGGNPVARRSVHVARRNRGLTRQRSALALAAALALSGCSGRIWLDHASAEGATLHWYTEETTIREAQGKADEHCRQFDKHAQLVDEFEDQDVTTAHFACSG
jgi:hypothetical protein